MGQAQPNHWRRISLQHCCFILGLNNAPMLGTILPLDCQKVPGVRIHPSPHVSKVGEKSDYVPETRRVWGFGGRKATGERAG